ncbi:CDP-glycerol glycerophosphotransferase family protein [Endozoicomonas sp. Mp262]|uniref:CDP-glycerol glycerophosphotransferase family protein n=1 Tax=Endozoicomonas sp. Mp262 TaxID=2919499 RepID=UPI0021D96992
MSKKLISKLLFPSLSRVIKKKNIIFFFIDKEQTWGGNLRALFEHIYQKGKFKTIIINNGITPNTYIQSMYSKTEVYSTLPKNKILDALKAKVFIITHGKKPLLGWFTGIRGYKLVNVWHGIPIKAVGNLQKNYTEKGFKKTYKRSQDYDLFCCSSNTDKAIMSACQLLHGNKLSITGIPKTDWLLCNENKLPKDYIEDLRRIKESTKGKKLVFYAPTFRDDPNDDYFFSDNEIGSLVKYLDQNNLILGVRYHGVALQNNFRAKHQRLIKNNSIIDLGADQYSESNIILRQTSILICDYSSIFVDYLLLDRPIIRFAYDLNKYKKSRGLLYNYEKVLPGQITYSIEDIKSNIDDQLVSNLKEEYNAKWIFHHFTDDQSCQRIYDEILTMTGNI